jgi:hypothetical protein
MLDRQSLEYVAREQYFMKLHCVKMCDTHGGKKGNLVLGASSRRIAAIIISASRKYLIHRIKMSGRG